MKHWYQYLTGHFKIIDYVFRKSVTKSIFIKLHHNIGISSGGWYIIKRKNPAGFFSDFFYVLGHFSIAEEFGLKPYVDMEQYPSLYSENTIVNGTNNAWEYYFTQKYTKKEVYSQQHIFCEEKYPYGIVPYYSTTNFSLEGRPSINMVTKLNQTIQKYIHIRTELLKEFEEESYELSLSECLGIHIRGTDMKQTSGHNAPVALEKMIAAIRNVIEHKHFRKIFLCTDEDAIRQRIQDEFKDKNIDILYTKAYRAKNTSDGLHLERRPNIQRKLHRYLLGKEVLKDAFLLSKCKSLLCGYSNVAYAAIVLNNNHFVSIDYIIK